MPGCFSAISPVHTRREPHTHQHRQFFAGILHSGIGRPASGPIHCCSYTTDPQADLKQAEKDNPI
jgi:hypothetical protein